MCLVPVFVVIFNQPTCAAATPVGVLICVGVFEPADMSETPNLISPEPFGLILISTFVSVPAASIKSGLPVPELVIL